MGTQMARLMSLCEGFPFHGIKHNIRRDFMHPLKKTLVLSLLNVFALLILRFDDLSRTLFSGREIVWIKVTGGHFMMFWIIGMMMILVTALVAGKLSLPNTISFRQMFLAKH